MVIGAHSDDVECICGGTFARLVRQGAQGCYVVAVTGPYVNPPILNQITTTAEAIDIRRNEAVKASKILGAKQIVFLNAHTNYYYKKEINPKKRLIYPTFTSYKKAVNELKDTAFDGNIPIQYAVRNKRFLRKVETLIRKWNPETIFSHNMCDGHTDHNAVSFMIGSILRETELNRKIAYFQGRQGGMYPMLPYYPGIFVELSEDDIDIWQKAFDCYISQFPYNRLKSYAKKYAEACGELCGVKYAQPFTQTIDLDKYDRIKDVKKYVYAEYRRKPPEVIKL